MAKNDIIYQSIIGISKEAIYNAIEKLYSKIFKDADLDFFKQRINNHSQLHSVLAYSNSKLVGFKIGYPYNNTTFYSWIGGVLPKYRQQGIATQMIAIQEKHATTKGFTSLRTKSMNRFKPMMILNLKNGFNITDIYTNTKGQTKIVFEKTLI